MSRLATSPLMRRHAALFATSAAVAFAAAPASAQNADSAKGEIHPYVEVDQSIFTDLSDDASDVETYTTVAVGVDATVQTRRAAAQASIRYGHEFSYDNNRGDSDNVSGIVNGAVQVHPNVSVGAGAIATRTRIDSRGAAPGFTPGDTDNVGEVYSGYAGINASGPIGPATAAASYNVGYTKVDDSPTGPLVGTGQPVETFDNSLSHSANASIGMQPGQLPVGWAVGASYAREDGSQLDTRYEDFAARADLTVPVSQTLAIVGGAGYEKVTVSERAALIDPNTNQPVRDGNGRLVTDPTSPRLSSFTTDGLIWDVGVMWRPSNRTSLEARVGQRYDSTTYYGAFTFSPSSREQVGIAVYDEVTGFGGRLNDTLASLGTSFDASRSPTDGLLTGCTYGGANALCYGAALANANGATFRSRGVTASAQRQLGRWKIGSAIGYNRRDYLVADTGSQANLNGQKDEAYFASLSAGTPVGRTASIDFNTYANYFQPALSDDDILNVGANAGYGLSITRQLQFRAAAGLDYARQENVDETLTATGLVGLRLGL